MVNVGNGEGDIFYFLEDVAHRYIACSTAVGDASGRTRSPIAPVAADGRALNRRAVVIDHQNGGNGRPGAAVIDA